jgi:sugar phosphate isomerase/epimerase
MWSRRAFLEYGSLSLAAMTCLETQAAAQPGTGPLGRPIGLQLYTVREDAAKDLPGTLKTIAAIGYREVELAGIPPVKAADLRKMLTDLGLTAPSMHAGMADLQKGVQERIDYAQALGAQHIVCSFPWTADSRFSKGGSQAIAAGITMDDWKWNADELNRIGELTRKAGIRCGYHNHNMEFRTYPGLADGLTAFDDLLKRTDPKLVTIELDIAWVATAGIDPLHYLRRHPQRISLLHVKEVRKDLKPVRDRIVSQTTEVGSGKIDWKTLFAAMDPKYIRHYFVEQENFERPPLEAVKISYEYLRRLG